MLRRVNFLLLVPVLALAACEPSRTASRPDGDTIREITGVGESARFPQRVGIFQRERVLAYAEGFHDVSIGYRSTDARQPAVSTIYLYPAYTQLRDFETTQEWEFRFTKGQIARYPDGDWVWEREEVDVLQRSGQVEGISATYRFRTTFFGELREVQTELHLFLLGDRFVKFRHSYPAELEEEIEPHIDELMASLSWEDAEPKDVATSLGQRP